MKNLLALARWIVRPWVPPILVDAKLHLFPPPPPPQIWAGDYPDWGSAKRDCAGYDDQRLIERIRAAALAVKSGQVVAERDSVLLPSIPYRWPVIAALLRAGCASDNRLRVMDFGGALGTSYYHDRAYLAVLDRLEWNVVEQPKLVEIGRREFGDDLGFFTDAAECVAQRSIDLILISGVLQYLPTPHRTLHELLGLGVRHVVLDRTAFWSGEARDRLTVQKSDFGDIRTSYPAWFFHEPVLLAVFAEMGYRQIVEFEGLDRVGFRTSRHKGFYFVREGESQDG